MENWSGRVKWNPESVQSPSSEEEIQKIIIQANNDAKKVRIIGTGHSFTPLYKTNEILINLDQYQGIISIDKEKLQATIKAGTKLFVLGDLLYQQGMAMENMGDIDKQSLGGTISTGTHGTGLKFGTISTQVVALKFINGKGEIISCSQTNNPTLFKAAQVALGSLGIISEITLQCVPAYKLELWNRQEKMIDVLSNFKQRNQENRNFEFYWFPYTKTAWTKTSNIVDDQEPDKINAINYFVDYAVENYCFKILAEMARVFPSQNINVAKISAATIPDVKKVYQSHKIYATPRLVRFNEMEYNVPLEASSDVLKDVMKLVNSKKFNIHFPIEHRVVKADDIYLSPAYERDSFYIACHVYNKKDYEPYFKALEEIFRAHDGRPHWGKMHFLKASDLRSSYPMFDTFIKHRNEQDPNKIFISPYFEELFGLTA